MTCAIYARKSTDQNGVSDEQKSVARQVEHAKAYATRKGWTVSDESVYVDDGISGAEFLKRPGFVRLMAAAAVKPRPAFDVLVMSEESRLGREMIETSFALKQIITAGVRIFYYMEDRERTLDSPTDKIMLSLTAFADELEREKARLRVTNAMVRHARAGHVTGGRVFGYTNVEILGPDGKRSHVERQINAQEAAIVRRIFGLCADGYGRKAITKLLNQAGAVSPRAQRGRSQTWAPSSVGEVLLRTTYRGVITWNQSKKRNRWGQHHQTARPSSDRIHVPAPQLRIVTDDEWQAAHARLEAARTAYLDGTQGQRFGRPPIGTLSKYLLTSFAECGLCGSTMKVLTRDHGRRRGRFYGCAGYHDRGRAVCSNGAIVPMDDADGIVLEAVLDDVLSADIIQEAVDQALGMIVGDKGSDAHYARMMAIERDIRRLESERQRLTDAIAAGGELSGLLDALKDREANLASLRDERDRLRAAHKATIDAVVVRDELLTLAADWRRVLASEPLHARPLLSQLLAGRVRFTPQKAREWEMRGQGTIAGLFTRLIAPGVPLRFVSHPSETPQNHRGSIVVPLGMASLAGFEPALPP